MMTNGQGRGQQDESWEHRRYDLHGHTERLRRLQTPPQGQPSPQEPPWLPPGDGQQQRYVPPQQRGYVPPQQSYVPPQPPAPEPSPPPTQNRTWKVLAGLGGFVIVILAFAVAANRAATHTASATTYRNSSATVSATPAAASSESSASAGHVIATFTGQGTRNTAKFTVTATWKLDYTFDCSNLGGAGSFQVREEGGSHAGLTVNARATRDTASAYAYHDAGTRYLKVSSGCSWTVKVIDQGS